MKPGSRIGPYEVQATLGRGGQGTVFRVLDTSTGAVRALKLLEVRGLGDRTLERMRREARLLAQLQHPGLVRCHEFFERYADGTAGLVMDVIDGSSLADAAADPRMDDAHRWAVLRGVAEALAHLHGRGLVHRDVKEDNVLVADAFWADPTVPGGVKLVDFGIAAVVGNPQSLTATDGFIGTLPYLPPEVLAPQPGVDPDTPKRDVFAFGVMACQLLHHRHPTKHSPDAKLWDFLTAYRAMAATTWGATLHPLVRACLEVDPARRLSHAGAILSFMAQPVGTAPMQEPTRVSTVPWSPPGPSASPVPVPAPSPPPPPVAGSTEPAVGTPIPPAAYTAVGPTPASQPVRRNASLKYVGALAAGALLALGVVLTAAVALTLSSGGSSPAPTRTVEVVEAPSPPRDRREVCECRDENPRRTQYPSGSSTLPGSCSSKPAPPAHYQLIPSGIDSLPGTTPPYQVCFGRDCYPVPLPDHKPGHPIASSDLKRGGTGFEIRDARGVVLRGSLPNYDLPLPQRVFCNGFFAPVGGTKFRFFLVR